MSSPFPGIDPFIEVSDRWPGFHNLLIGECSKQLNARLPQNYAAIVEERVELVELPNSPPRAHRRPDIGVLRDEPANHTAPRNAPVAVLTELEPATLTLPDYEEI